MNSLIRAHHEGTLLRTARALQWLMIGGAVALLFVALGFTALFYD